MYETSGTYDEAILEILGQPREAIICTAGLKSIPHSVPTWYLYENDCFYISTSSTGLRGRDVTENPKGRVLIVHSAGWISASGRAALILDERFDSLQDRVLERYLTDEGREHFKKAAAFPDDCILEIRAERKNTWSKMNIATNIQKAGYTLEESASWFVPIRN